MVTILMNSFLTRRQMLVAAVSLLAWRWTGQGVSSNESRDAVLTSDGWILRRSDLQDQGSMRA